MKRKLFAMTAALAVIGLIGLAPVSAGETHATVSKFEVSGMTCGGCSAAVRLAVKKMDGVEDVEVSHDDNSATVKYDADKVTPEDIVKVIEKQGFKAKVTETKAA